MANVLTHRFVSAKPAGTDTTKVRSTDWNEGHSFTGGSNGMVLTRNTTDTLYGAAWTATPSLTTVTVPLVIGGVGAGSQLALRSTAGVGTADAIVLQVGNNGATEAIRVHSNGRVDIGVTPPTTPVTDPGNLNVTVSNQTGLRFESKGTGAFQGATIGLASNTNSVYDFGVQIRNLGGVLELQTTSLARIHVAKSDYLFALGDGLTASNPALKRLLAALQVRLGDDSAFAQLDALLTAIVDGVTAPGATVGQAKIYVDVADGDLKVVFGDGVVKTLATDT